MKNIRLTSARKAILEHIEEAEAHLMATQIHLALSQRLPSLNLTTVYRSLDYLVEHKLISVADIGKGSPVYEKVSETLHHHLICQKCHAIAQIDHSHIAPFFQKLNQETGFEVTSNHIALYGICENCH